MENVLEGTVEVGYIIRATTNPTSGKVDYDWIAGRAESEEYFDSIDEAEAAVKAFFDE